MSGHNKWSTIKRKKGALDAKRSKIFSKIIKEITVAVKESGPDPDGNPRLRMAVQNAKGANMPKDNVQRAITKAGSDTTTLEEVTFEGYAVGGVALFVECLTDNNLRTVSAVRANFNKRGGSLGTKGSLSFIFDRKGIFSIPKTNVKGSLDDFELEIIDAGAEDFDVSDEQITITTAMEDFGKVNKKLEELNITVENAELQRIPNTSKKVDVDTAKSVMKMIESFEDIDDVQNIYHNMELTDDIQAALEADD